MADQGNIGIERPTHARRLTDHQANASGLRYATDPGTRRKLTDHQAVASRMTHASHARPEAA